jgi:hypothetical protein
MRSSPTSEPVRWASGSDGQGLGGGVYVLSGGVFNFDITDVVKKNHASTSNDDIYP